MNHATIAGHLGADPEVRFTSSGKKVTSLRVATRVRKGGKDDTIWWTVSVWGETFDKMIPYFKKGSPIIVVGDLNKPEIFTDREGKPQVSMSLTAVSLMFSPFGRPDAQGAHTGGSEVTAGAAPQAEPQVVQGQGKPAEAFHEDEVPF
jgi:single-strand DNA-binding protein